MHGARIVGLRSTGKLSPQVSLDIGLAGLGVSKGINAGVANVSEQMWDSATRHPRSEPEFRFTP